MTLFCDLDGTLIDSTERHVVLLKELLEKRGIECAVNDYLSFKADGGNTKAYLLRHGFPEAQSSEIAEQWRLHIEDDRYLLMDRCYGDTVEFLERYASMCQIIYVTARRRRDALLETLDRLGLSAFAAKVIIVDPARATDEKAVAVREIAGPSDLFVGDTEADMDCAQKVGIDGLMLNRGFRSEAFWRSRGRSSFESLTSLYMILDKNMIFDKKTEV